jgi:predicted nucleic acid-binding protein
VLSEVTYGAHSGAIRNPKLLTQLDWFLALTAAAMRALPLNADAAELAGELRARQPLPPTGRRRRPGQRSEQRIGWIMDLFITATAWVHGYDVVTYNVDDFSAIAGLLPSADPENTLRILQPDSL